MSNNPDDLDTHAGEPQPLDNILDKIRQGDAHVNFKDHPIHGQRLVPRMNFTCPSGSKASELLQTYVHRIVPYFLCITKGFRNLFVQDVLPMAFADMLVMNAVLAVGGSTRDIGRPANRVEEKEVLQYYRQANRERKLGLTK